eukprot:1333678-Pyramimonas_sp.AAC.1
MPSAIASGALVNPTRVDASPRASPVQVRRPTVDNSAFSLGETAEQSTFVPLMPAHALDDVRLQARPTGFPRAKLADRLVLDARDVVRAPVGVVSKDAVISPRRSATPNWFPGSAQLQLV